MKLHGFQQATPDCGAFYLSVGHVAGLINTPLELHNNARIRAGYGYLVGKLIDLINGQKFL